MDQKIKQLKGKFLQEISKISSLPALEQLEISYLGRKAGELTKVLRGLKDLTAEQKKEIGQESNKLKSEISRLIEEKRLRLKEESFGSDNFLDVTLPGIEMPQGHLHLVTHAIREITEIFEKIGFVRRRYPKLNGIIMLLSL